MATERTEATQDERIELELRIDKALALLHMHAASLDPGSFVSEVIAVLEGNDE